MMKALTAWCIVGATAEGLCFIPQGETCRTCQIEAETECIYEGDVKPCYTTVNACCVDGSITSTVGDCLYNTCNRMAGDSPEVYNEVCQDTCMTGNSDKFLFILHCSYQHYEVKDGRTVMRDEDCYDNMVHGHKDRETNALVGFRTVSNVRTPALCQLECQRDIDCERFLWTSELMVSSEKDQPRRCVLQSQSQVTGAYNQVFLDDGKPPTVEQLYCPMSAAQLCLDQGRQCLQCNGDGLKRCVYPSDMHVSGFKYCQDKNLCKTGNSRGKK